MSRLFPIGIAFIIITGTCIAADAVYDSGKLYDLADQIELEANTSIDKASTPSQVSQITGQAQMKFSRILMRQHDEIIRQNDKIIQQNEEIIRVLRKIPKQ